MNPILNNILVVIAGLFFGALVNGGLIMIGPSIIPLPEGATNKTIEEMNATMHLLQPKHYIFPFLAHALGTFFGAFLTAFFAKSRKLLLGMIVGVAFFLGGISMVMQLNAPLWFNLLDLIIAYLPTAYLASKLAISKTS